MSEDTSYGDATPETADTGTDAAQARSVGAEFDEATPAEPMSREEYADYMRQEPAADTGDDNSHDNGTTYASESGESTGPQQSDPSEQAQGMTREDYAEHMRQGPAAGTDNRDTGNGPDGPDWPNDSGEEPGSDDLAEQDQGMTRGEYADYMRQGPTAGEDGPSSAVAVDNSGPDGEVDPANSDNGTDASQHPDGQAATTRDPAEQPTEPLARQAVENGAGTEGRRNIPGELGEGGRNVDFYANSNDTGAAAKETSPQHEAAEEWPTPEERVRLHETYLDWRREVSVGRESGTNVIGGKPDRSPDDGRDLPPIGEELLESESNERSRLDALRKEFEDEEVLDDLHSEVEQNTNNIQSILEAHPPTGHPVQIMPDHPNIAPVAPAGIGAGSVATAGLVVGVVLVEAGRRIHDMLRQRREAGHAR